MSEGDRPLSIITNSNLAPDDSSILVNGENVSSSVQRSTPIKNNTLDQSALVTTDPSAAVGTTEPTEPSSPPWSSTDCATARPNCPDTPSHTPPPNSPRRQYISLVCNRVALYSPSRNSYTIPSTPYDTPAPTPINTEFVASLLEPKCIECGRAYSHDDAIPRILACGLSICHNCVRQKQDENGRVTCPACHTKTECYAIRRNYALDDIQRIESNDSLPRTLSEMAQRLGAVCQICLEAYSAERLPFVLPCGHTYCGLCLSHLRSDDGGFKCPNRCLPNQPPSVEAATAPPVSVNRGLMNLVNILRTMNGLHPAAASPRAAPPIIEQEVQTTSPNANENPDEAINGINTNTPPPSQPAWLMAIVLTYVMVAAMVSIIVALTQGPSCVLLRRWLGGLAAILLATPAVTVLSQKQFRRMWRLMRNVIGIVFFFWLAYGLTWAWMKPQDDCPTSSLVWVVCTTLLILHLTLFFLHLLVEVFLYHSGRSQQARYLRQATQFMPFQGV